jgi:hypothetical protein
MYRSDVQRSLRRCGSGPLCRALGVALLLFCAAALHAEARAQQETAELSGAVRGPDGKPMAGVHLLVLGTKITALTDGRGRYELRGIPRGQQRIEVEFLGYRTVRLQLEFLAGVPLRRDVELEIVALPGAPLEARTGSGMSPQLAGFYSRMERGQGFYFTADDIARMQARQFTDVLRRVPGLRMQPMSGPFGTSYMVQMGRTTGAAGASSCPVLFFLNGMPFAVASDIGIDTFVRPDEIAGIEVYSRSATPSQFSATHVNARCGVIVIWTHAGRPRRDQ